MSSRKQRRDRANRFRELYVMCPNCAKPGPHFVPPSLGDPGFFICDTHTEPQENTDG